MYFVWLYSITFNVLITHNCSCVIQDVPFILSLTMESSSHRNLASAVKSSDSLYQEHYKTNIL